MRVIIAGSRTITDISAVNEAVIASGFEITEVVSGCARGVDKLGEQWAAENGVPVKPFPALWKTYGHSAGPIRNAEMAVYAAEENGGLIACWDGTSSGTKNMINNAKLLGLKNYVHMVE